MNLDLRMTARKGDKGHNATNNKASQGYKTQFKIKRYHTRPNKAIQGNTRPYKAIQGHTRPYKVIQGHTRPYKTIQSHKRPRTANQYHISVPKLVLGPLSFARGKKVRYYKKRLQLHSLSRQWRSIWLLYTRVKFSFGIVHIADILVPYFLRSSPAKPSHIWHTQSSTRTRLLSRLLHLAQTQFLFHTRNLIRVIHILISNNHIVFNNLTEW